MLLFHFEITKKPTGAVVEDMADGAEGLGFYSRVGQIGHSDANGLLLLRHFFVAALPKR